MRVIAPDAGQVEHLGSPVAPDRGARNSRRYGSREQRRNDVAPGIEIGGDEHQLAETRLTEVLRSTSA